MKKRITKAVSAFLAIALLIGTFICFPVSAADENAPVIVKSEFYDNAGRTGNELPVSDLESYVSDGIKGGFGTPYTPRAYQSRFTVYRVYVQIDEGKTASDYSFRFLCGVVDTSGSSPVCRDRYVTKPSVFGAADTNVGITEEVVDGIPCVVCTYTIAQKPSLDLDPITTAEANGSADIPQLSRIFCKVTEVSTKAYSTTEKNAFYISEKYSKTSSRDLVAFVKENYDLGLLTPSVYYKNTSGEFTDKADGAVRLPGDKLELALYVPDLSDVPHITGMTAESMNSNYSAFTANSPEMHLEWYAANQSEKGEGYEEVYLGSSTYALHELFHEWYYEWQETGNYVLGTNTVSKLHPETTYSIGDELSVHYQYVYCKMRIEIKFGTVPGFLSLETEHFALPGFAEEAPPIVVRGDVNDDGRVNSRDTIALKKYNSNTGNGNINMDNADVSGDGRLNARDVMALKRLLAANG